MTTQPPTTRPQGHQRYFALRTQHTSNPTGKTREINSWWNRTNSKLRLNWFHLQVNDLTESSAKCTQTHFCSENNPSINCCLATSQQEGASPNHMANAHMKTFCSLGQIQNYNKTKVKRILERYISWNAFLLVFGCFRRCRWGRWHGQWRGKRHCEANKGGNYQSGTFMSTRVGVRTKAWLSVCLHLSFFSGERKNVRGAGYLQAQQRQSICASWRYSHCFADAGWF